MTWWCNWTPRDAIDAAFDSLVFLKTVTVVDTDIDIFDIGDVEWAVATRCRYEQDLVQLPESDGHRLNPMAEDGKLVRRGVDATIPLPREEKYVRTTMQAVDLSKFEIDD